MIEMRYAEMNTQPLLVKGFRALPKDINLEKVERTLVRIAIEICTQQDYASAMEWLAECSVELLKLRSEHQASNMKNACLMLEIRVTAAMGDMWMRGG